MGEITFEVREATPDDVSSVVSLSSRLFAEDAGTRDEFVDVRWPESEGDGYFSGVISAPDALCVVAGTDGEVVGYLVGRVTEEDAIRPVASSELESMYVLPEFRGRGIGAALVREFLRWSERRGARLASVTAYHSNARAVAFYERLGFAPRSVTLARDLSST